MGKAINLIIMFIVILLIVIQFPLVHSEDAEKEWTEHIIIEGSCSSENVRTRFQVNSTVVEITVNLSWTTENGYADLDMWIEGTDAYVVDTSSSSQIPELLNVRDFPNRGRWTLVVVPIACGSSGGASYFANITLRNIVLPKLEVFEANIGIGDSVNMSINSTYENVSLYFFDFGDGENSGWVNHSFISKTYNKSGEYIPKVKVRYSDGTESDWVQAGAIDVQVDEEENVILWVIIWMVILEAIIFLAIFLHSKRKGF